VKKTVVLSALALAATAGSAFGIRLETRFLIQTQNGLAGASYAVNTIWTPGDPPLPNFAPGANVRFTVQYNITQADGATQFPLGLSATNFSILGTGPAGGATQKSRLWGLSSGATDTQKGEAFAALAGNYPNSGTGRTDVPAFNVKNGLHNAFRGGLADPDGTGPLTADAAPGNGLYSGSNINLITPIALSGALFAPTGGPNGDFTSTGWTSLFSFEYVHSGANGAKTFTVSPTTDAQNPNGQWGYFDAQGGAPITSNQFLNGSVTVNFGSSNTAPTVTPQNISGVVTNGSPAPDLNGALIGQITDAEGITAAQCSAAVMGASPFNAPSFSFVQVNANTVNVLITWEMANQDLVGGPGSFMVKLTGNDGIAPAVQDTATVSFVPAPGAAALLGLGGLIAGRRRRQA